MKRIFFQAVVVSILLYGCTTWTLIKQLEKKLDGNYTRMLRAILNNPGGNTPQSTNYTAIYLPPRKTIQDRRTRCAGHCWRSRGELISDILLWTPTYSKSKTTSSNIHTAAVRIRDVALKTCQRRWTIGRRGERGGQGYPCWRHDMMMMIFRTLLISSSSYKHTSGLL